METKSVYGKVVEYVSIKTHILHRAFESRALLCVFPEWGTSLWISPGMLKDPENININLPGKLQTIFVRPVCHTIIENAIFKRKWDLLKYKKGEKR